MKGLTVRQPWAWAIVAGGKDVENRSWRTHYRGWVAIHAAAGRRADLSELPRGVRHPDESELAYGAIIGVARIDDVVDRVRSKWFEGEWGWVLGGVRRLATPVPCKGALGLWTVPAPVAGRVRRQLSARLVRVL